MNTKKKTYYITTPIYYANDKPHIGHAYTTLIADVFARYYRKKIGNENVFFLTGMDEHGDKIAKSAADNGLAPQKFVDLISQEYIATWDKLNISHDAFIRTTDPRHTEIVQKYLQDLYNDGYIYKGKYKGLYCIGCEKYLSYEEIFENTCVYHPNVKLVEQEEKNYFINLKKLSAKVLGELKNGSYEILPKERSNEIIGKINQGVNDISISRAGVSWGVPLPWDRTQTVYVWVDALLNYYSATKIFPNKEKFWPPDMQLMAKDILWFHALVWESLLIAHKIELPKLIYAHGFFTIDGQKMSKSLGNIIDPRFLVAEYGCDGTRYLLLTSFALGNDGDISLIKFKEKYNADLANGLGNLVARIAKLCEKVIIDGSIYKEKIDIYSNVDVEKWMKQYRPDEALKSIWNSINKFNQDIDNDKPWQFSDDKLIVKLSDYAKRILKLGSDLQPFLPSTSEKIISIFSDKKIKKPDSLFLRKS